METQLSSNRSSSPNSRGPTPSTSTTTSNHSVPTATATPTPKPKRSLRILCFGDSLTSGYPSSHPYAERLTAVLSRALPNLLIEPHIDGKPGDTVVGGSFQSRIEPKFLTKGGGNPFDWTIVLGGTNDLAFAFDPHSVFHALRRVWAVPLSKGGRVLACTVPETGVKGGRGKALQEQRNTLNSMIKQRQQENL